MFRYIVLLALVPAILATTGVKNCEDKTIALPDYVKVEGCDAAPCNVALGSKALMTLGFKAPRTIESFSPSVRAGVLGIFIDYALPENLLTGCDHLEGSRCPLSEGEDVVYNFEFPVEDNYPKISVDVDLALSDSQGKFVCVRIPVKVVA